MSFKRVGNDHPNNVIYCYCIKAYDEAQRVAYCKNLSILEWEKRIIQVNTSFLSLQTFIRVKIDECFINPSKILNGVRQGTVLGPLTVPVYMIDRAQQLRSHSFRWRLAKNYSVYSVLKVDPITLYL